MEQVSNLNDLFDTSGADMTVTNDRGIHRKGGTTKWNGAPVAVDIKIKIKYDAKDEYEPWSYELTLPLEQSFKSFIYEFGVPVDLGNRINGGNATFISAEQAEKAATDYAKHLTRRYRNYLDGKAKAKEYTLTLPLDSADNKE